MQEYTDIHSDYVIFIALPLQQLLNERDSMLRYTYIVCLVCDIDLLLTVFVSIAGSYQLVKILLYIPTVAVKLEPVFIPFVSNSAECVKRIGL